MRTKQRTAAYGAALVALAGALTFVAPQTASAENISVCDLSKKVDELRAWDANDQYNIIVWKESARETSQLNGVVAQGATAEYACNDHSGNMSAYFWAVFRDGEFTRKGDGGYRNWAFYGNFTRNDKHVQFYGR